MTPIGRSNTYPRIYSLIYGLVSFLFLWPAYSQTVNISAQNISNSRDIVFVIENSGKMQILDPQSVRRVACKRLVSLLDDTDRVSVINFSGVTSPEIPFTSVDNQGNISKIFSAIDAPSFQDKSPNWFEALSAARDIIDKSPNTENRDAHIILVSIDPMRLDNQKQTQHLNPKIATNLLPWFKANNVKINTVTFFKNAADPLFEEIASQTGGHSEIIASADLLPDVFDKLLNTLKPRDTMAANAGEFILDDATENFYLINQPLHGKQTYSSLKLTGPDEITLTFDSHPDNVLWTRNKYFETIVVKQAKKGHWTIIHETSKENFNGITLYTTTKPKTYVLQYRFIPDNIHAGEKITVVAWLTKNNTPVTDPKVINFLKTQLQIYQDNKLEQSISLYPMRTQPGRFSTSFVVKHSGESQFELKIYDNSFQQTSQFKLTVQPVSVVIPASKTATEDNATEAVTPETSIEESGNTPQLLFSTQEQALLIVIILNAVVIIIGLFIYFKKRRENNFFYRSRVPDKEPQQTNNSFSFAPQRKTV